MCGFAGYLDTGYELSDRGARFAILEEMTNAIISRGPDDSGFWEEDFGNGLIGLGHRRLAIVDLSPAGHQPMSCTTGRYVLIFNGEIYNHLEIRRRLQIEEGMEVWRGHSDTETLLAGFLAWGVEKTLKISQGMFALALWDKHEKTLTLARDRMGEKPLYYGWQQRGGKACFLFGSEIKALKKHPKFNGDINRSAIAALLQYNCIGGEYSIYDGINKLLPGNILKISINCREPIITPFWVMSKVAEEGVNNVFEKSEDEIASELESLLRSAISQQMLADVPVGAFLSGGIDSSAIVALMQSQSNLPIKTFTIGFNEDGYDEAIHAKKIARHLGTDHTELYVTPKQALDVIPNLPKIFCEPFSDSSQIPTYLVSQLAKKNVTVALSGDAGDELFSGYNRYVFTDKVWGSINMAPIFLRKTISASLLGTSPSTLNRWMKPMQNFLPKSFQMTNWGDKLHKAGRVLNAKNINELYKILTTHWDPTDIVLGYEEYLDKKSDVFCSLNDIQCMMLMDSMIYLPDDILTKVDRAAMGVSLETRVPFLDHRVVEFSWKIPQSMKINNGVGKWILRKILYKYVPESLIDRPKMGFGIPLDMWLRGELRDWAEDLLDESKLRQQGYLNPMPIRKKWNEHLSGTHNWQHHLWDVLMFQAWLMEQK